MDIYSNSGYQFLIKNLHGFSSNFNSGFLERVEYVVTAFR